MSRLSGIGERLLTNVFYCCIQTFRDIREIPMSLAGCWEPDKLLRARSDGARQVSVRPEKAVWDSRGNGSRRNYFTAYIY